MSVSTIAERRSEDAIHRELASFNRMRLRPTIDRHNWRSAIANEQAMLLREREWLERERAELSGALRGVPEDADAFIGWFEALVVQGPGQADPLFPWLAQHATREQMQWFLRQELAGEAGFDDLVALTQVKLPARAKLELARNYWDEMGRGKQAGMHGPMLDRLAEELEVDSAGAEPVCWESLALGNLLLALASHRDLTYQSIGALGAVELTAPGRCEQVDAGLRRLGISGVARRYYALHAKVDLRHSEAWNREVLRPLVAADPSLARPIAEGALLRLQAGARCFARYRERLGLLPRALVD